MANDNGRSLGKINKRLDNLSSTVDSLYQSTYKSRVDNRRDMENILGSIDDNLDNILTKINNQNIEVLVAKQNEEKKLKELEDLLDD